MLKTNYTMIVYKLFELYVTNFKFNTIKDYDFEKNNNNIKDNG